ncbi:hypothetical protein VNO77_36807 [Canavalia gladiata]|uniref:Secreted protein n=1 Tax=Canavalia gladiata TaxID=3824 RepID=A0AAN9K9W2_CANGL
MLLVLSLFTDTAAVVAATTITTTIFCEQNQRVQPLKFFFSIQGNPERERKRVNSGIMIPARNMTSMIARNNNVGGFGSSSALTLFQIEKQ